MPEEEQKELVCVRITVIISMTFQMDPNTVVGGGGGYLLSQEVPYHFYWMLHKSHV